MGSNTSTGTTLLSGKLYLCRSGSTAAMCLRCLLSTFALLVINIVHNSQPLQLAMIAHMSYQVVPCLVVYTNYITPFLSIRFLRSYLLHCLLLVANSVITADLAMIVGVICLVCVDIIQTLASPLCTPHNQITHCYCAAATCIGDMQFLGCWRFLDMVLKYQQVHSLGECLQSRSAP